MREFDLTKTKKNPSMPIRRRDARREGKKHHQNTSTDRCAIKSIFRYRLINNLLVIKTHLVDLCVVKCNKNKQLRTWTTPRDFVSCRRLFFSWLFISCHSLTFSWMKLNFDSYVEGWHTMVGRFWLKSSILPPLTGFNTSINEMDGATRLVCREIILAECRVNGRRNIFMDTKNA